MNVAIFVYPNSTESWGQVAPIGNIVVPNYMVFPVGLTPSVSSGGTVVLGRLMEMGTIDKSISILSNRGLDDDTFTGIGGIAKTGDFTFTLSNMDNMIDPFMFLGRTIKVALFNAVDSTGYYSSDTDLMVTEGNCRFTGYISDIDKSSMSVVFTVSDSLNRSLKKEIGTEITGGGIRPINYGVFSEVEMKGLFEDMGVYSRVCVDDFGVKSVSKLKIYDKNLEEFYSIERSDLLSGLNRFIRSDTISASTNYKAYLAAELGDDTQTVKISSPAYRAYLSTSEVSLTPGDEYIVPSTPNFIAKFITELDGYLIFTDPDGSSISFSTPSSGTLTEYQGTSTIPYQFVSEVISPYVSYDKDEMGSTYDRDPLLDAVAAPAFIKINNEVILLSSPGLVTLVDLSGTYKYDYTEYTCYRAQEDTTSVIHDSGEEVTVYIQKEDTLVARDSLGYFLDNKKWLFTHLFMANGISGMGPVYGEGDAHVDYAAITLNSLDDLISNTGHLDVEGPLGIGEKFGYNFDLLFKGPELNGQIINMYLHGRYEISSSAAADQSGYMYIGKGGLPWPSDLYNAFFGGRATLPDNATPGVIAGQNVYLLGNYPSMFNSVFDVTTQQYFAKSPQFTHFSIATFTIHNEDTASGIVWGVSRFDTITVGRNNKKEISFRDRLWGTTQTLNGCLNNISELGSSRYFLTFNSTKLLAGGLRFSVSQPGFLITFYIDISNKDIWLNGEGRTNNFSQVYTSPEAILEGFLLKDYGLVATSDTYPLSGFTTTLSINGPRTSQFSKIEDFCKKHALVLVSDSAGAPVITNCLMESFSTGTAILLDDSLILPDFEQTYSKVDSLISAINHKYCLRRASDEYLKEYETQSYVNNFLQDSNTVTFKNEYVADTASGEAIAESLLNFYKRPIRELKVFVKLTSTIYKIGQWCIIDSNVVRDTSGHGYLITGVEEQLPCASAPYVRLTLLELTTFAVAISNDTYSDIAEIKGASINEKSTDDITEFSAM